jgi:general secretion pathway protein H
MAKRGGQGLQPISRILRNDRTAGFTLIEVVAVMLIVSLTASIVMATLAGTGRTRLKALALETAALLRRERLGAILTGHNRDVFLDNRQLVGQAGSVAIPNDVVLAILGAKSLLRERQSIVRFHPDGASSGTVLRLSREGAGYEVRVNWFTGGVVVGEQE